MAGTSYNIERVSFLVVEDNDHMRSLVRNILNALGAHQIRESADVPAAYDLLKAFPIDIVICDWQMVPVSGLDFVKAIRMNKESPFRFMPVIMLTAHSEMKKVTEARDAGVNEFVMKPISARTLYARIREIIKNPRPFIETADYFGPDRRRKQMDMKGAPDRRGQTAPADGQAEPVVAPAASNG